MCDMSEKDKILCFVEDLKPWARAKLYEPGEQDLHIVYAAIEQLFDLNEDPQKEKRQTSSQTRQDKIPCSRCSKD